MTVRERVIQEVLHAPPQTLKRVMKALRAAPANGKPGRKPAEDKPFEPIAFGLWKGRIPDSMSSEEWLRQQRERRRLRRLSHDR